MSQQHDQLDDGEERHLLPDLNPQGRSDCMEKTEDRETPRQRKAAEWSLNGHKAAYMLTRDEKDILRIKAYYNVYWVVHLLVQF